MSRSATPVSREGFSSVAGTSDSNGGVFEEGDIRQYSPSKMPLPGWPRLKYLERQQLSVNKNPPGKGVFSPRSTDTVQRSITASLQPYEAVTLYHGVRRKMRIPLERKVVQVVFHRLTKLVVTADSRGITAWRENAVCALEPHCTPLEHVRRVLPVLQSSQFVALCGKRTIKLLNSNFATQFAIDAPHRLSSCEYNEAIHTLVSCGGADICSWDFILGNKELRCFSTIVIPESLLGGQDVSSIHLEGKKSRSQRCFAAVHRSLLVYCLYSRELITSLKNAHSREITCVLHCRTLKLLCTAGRDGSIHVWDESYNLQQSFVGHVGSVTSLQPYPHGPLVVSSSSDETIRVWNLLNGAEVDRLPAGHPVDGLVAHGNIDTFVSISPACLDVWKMNYLYRLLTPMDIDIQHVHNTQNPVVPMRLVVECVDSAIRLTSPETGDILTTALLPVGTPIVSTVYEAEQERLYVLRGGGQVERFDTSLDCPARRLAPWPADEICDVTAICLYEFIMDKEAVLEATAQDRWYSVALDAGYAGHPGSMDKTMLIAGNCRGQLMVIDQRKKIRVAFTVKGHSAPVHHIVCSPKLDRLVSASSEDRNVCVWRVFPYCEEAFSLLRRIVLIYPPSHLAVCQQRLCITWDNEATADYSLQMYDLVTKERFTHSPDVDHADRILSLSTLDCLGLVASASVAGDVRVWTLENELVRTIHLNAAPQSLCFCSYQGDLALAISGHLHKIKSSMYLPRQMMQLTLAATMAKCGLERSRPLSSSAEQLPEEDKQRLIGLSSAIRGYTPSQLNDETASLDGTRERCEEQLRKQQMEQHFYERDMDLVQLRDGTYSFERQKPVLTMKEKAAALKSLLGDLTVHKRPRPVIEKLDKFDCEDSVKGFFPTEVLEQLHIPALANINKFFPPLSTFEPPYPIAPDGHIPNSVVLKDLRKSAKDQELADEWKLKPLTDEQLAALSAIPKPVPIVEKEEDEPPPPTKSRYLEKLQAAMKKEVKPKTPEPTPPSTPPPEPAKERATAPRKPLVKLVAPKAKPKTPPPTPPSPSPTPPREPSPPPPEKVPEFIRRQLHRTFIPEFFPGADEYTFPPPHTVDAFVRKLVDVLVKSAKLRMKVEVLEVLDALAELKWQEKDTTALVTNSLLSLLHWQPDESDSTSAPAALAKFHAFLVHILNKLGVSADAVAVCLMVHYVLAQSAADRLAPMQRLLMLGLVDDRNFLGRELDSWLVDRSPEAGTIKARRQVGDWLTSWGAKMEVEMTKKSISKLPSRKPLGKTADTASAQSIDVLNFFVRYMIHQEELALLQARAPPPPRPAAKPPTPEPGTAMALVPLPQVPVRSLARFGETHCSKCHPERESTLATSFHLPPINERKRGRHQDCLLHGFPRSIRLPLKPQTLQLEDSDEEDSGLGESASSSSSSLFTGSKKFFMLEQSIVPEMRHR